MITKLLPLQQWICDTCGKIIESPGDGWLEWVYDQGQAHDFRIVHHLPKSPIQRAEGCYQHGMRSGRADMHLDSYLGADGLASLLSFLAIGQIDPDDSGPRVESTRELAELIRRLQLPHYEEARIYWADAERDGYFSAASESWPYLQRTLTRLIEKYGPKERG